MKSPVKLSLGLLAASLTLVPAVMNAQDASSQPSSSAPATTTSAASTPSTTADSSAPAPKKKHGHDESKHMLKMLQDKLSLTDDESSKVKAILEDQGKQMATINDDASLSEEDKHAKLAALRKSTHDQIRALLTPDQQTTFDSLKMDHGHKKADN